jgi:hypothetical protein
MNNDSNKNDLLSLKNDIMLLTNEVDAARIKIADGNRVSLNEFQIKVSIFCEALNTNPPPETDTPKVLSSIEALIDKINDLQNELTELEVGTPVESSDVKKNGDIA